jgi:hypothetical protein
VKTSLKNLFDGELSHHMLPVAIDQVECPKNKTTQTPTSHDKPRTQKTPTKMLQTETLKRTVVSWLKSHIPFSTTPFLSADTTRLNYHLNCRAFPLVYRHWVLNVHNALLRLARAGVRKRMRCQPVERFRAAVVELERVRVAG